MARTKTLLKEAQEKMESLMKDMAEVSGKLEAFTKSVSKLSDEQSSRYKNTVKSIRLTGTCRENLHYLEQGVWG